MQVINTGEDVAPNVWPNVASLVETTWGKQHKDNIKQIYYSHKRPNNTPSFQKVVLDSELYIPDQRELMPHFRLLAMP